jgi:hypothetical protein
MSTFGAVSGQMDTMPLWAFVLANSLVIIEFLVDCSTILITIPIFYLIWRTSVTFLFCLFYIKQPHFLDFASESEEYFVVPKLCHSGLCPAQSFLYNSPQIHQR